MERSRGIRRWIQGMLFPDLVNLLDAHEELERRMSLLDKSLGVLDKSIGTLDKSIGTLDESVDQLDKGMVQTDHGLNRLDKEMIRLNKGIEQLNKGMDQMNKDVDERERDLTIRLEKLKAKLEADHARAMGEVAALLETHAYDDRNPDHGHGSIQVSSHTEVAAGVPAVAQDQKTLEVRNRALIEPDRARAISELSAALGPQAPVEEFQGHLGSIEPEPDHARALDELAALLGSAQRREEAAREELSREPSREAMRDPMRDEPYRFARANNGQPPPLDFAAILEHIRNREATI